MSTFEAPNDYRNYLCHYGVKGMKWRKHRRSQMNKNFQLPDNNDNEFSSDNVRRRRGTSEFSRENTHRPTLIDERNNREDTRHRDGGAPAPANVDTRSRRRHDLTWERTHSWDSAGVQNVVGHIPRTAHTAENATAARDNLNRKKKRK